MATKKSGIRMTEARRGPEATASYDPRCTRCPRLAGYLATVRARHPGYFARPVPSFGDPQARLIIVGLAPGLHGANRTGRPFTGDHAGILLYETLYAAGLSSQPTSVSAEDPLRLLGARIVNSVKCLPPANKPLPEEIGRCNSFLTAELASLGEARVYLALGRVAHEAVLRARDLPRSGYPFAHGREHRLGARLTMLDSYHCSRYNTQTRRLTAAMFRAVVARACELAGLPVAPALTAP
jgi:uracil-DNA glycosylase family 4